MWLTVDCKTVVFGRFGKGAKRRKRDPRVWGARASHAADVWGEKTTVFFSVSPHSPSPFLHSLQTFRSNMDLPSLVFAKK